MSSNIEVQRVCEHCGNDFLAKTTTTRYCSKKCNGAAHKLKIKNAKIEISNKQTQQVKTQSIELIQAKDFLSVREVARLLNCSIRTVYYHIENGTIKAVNLGQRITRVKRSEIDKLFEQPQPEQPQPKQKDYDISECYTISEVQNLFGISQTALQNLIKRESIPKFQRGRFTYVPKILIDKLLN